MWWFSLILCGKNFPHCSHTQAVPVNDRKKERSLDKLHNDRHIASMVLHAINVSKAGFIKVDTNMNYQCRHERN